MSQKVEIVPEEHFFKFRTRLMYMDFEWAMHAAERYKREGEITTIVGMANGRWGLNLYDKFTSTQAAILYNNIINPPF